MSWPTGPVTVTLSEDEKIACVGSLATQAQTLAMAPQSRAIVDMVDASWSAAAKIAGVSVDELKRVLGVRRLSVEELRTMAAGMIAELELEIAKQRVKDGAQG